METKTKEACIFQETNFKIPKYRSVYATLPHHFFPNTDAFDMNLNIVLNVLVLNSDLKYRTDC